MFDDRKALLVEKTWFACARDVSGAVCVVACTIWVRTCFCWNDVELCPTPISWPKPSNILKYSGKDAFPNAPNGSFSVVEGCLGLGSTARRLALSQRAPYWCAGMPSESYWFGRRWCSYDTAHHRIDIDWLSQPHNLWLLVSVNLTCTHIQTITTAYICVYIYIYIYISRIYTLYIFVHAVCSYTLSFIHTQAPTQLHTELHKRLHTPAHIYVHRQIHIPRQITHI